MEEIKTVELPFTMQPQQGHAICWAAVGVSCAHFYDPSSQWNQCKMAFASLVPTPKADCCGDIEHSSCNVEWYLDAEKDDRRLGAFVTAQIDVKTQAGPIAFEDLIKEIDQNRVVAYMIQVDLDGKVNLGGVSLTSFNHFIVITGYSIKEDGQYVTVQDSYFGKSEITYQEFLTNYKCNGMLIKDVGFKDSIVIKTIFSKPPKQP